MCAASSSFRRAPQNVCAANIAERGRLEQQGSCHHVARRDLSTMWQPQEIAGLRCTNQACVLQPSLMMTQTSLSHAHESKSRPSISPNVALLIPSSASWLPFQASQPVLVAGYDHNTFVNMYRMAAERHCGISVKATPEIALAGINLRLLSWTIRELQHHHHMSRQHCLVFDRTRAAYLTQRCRSQLQVTADDSEPG